MLSGALSLVLVHRVCLSAQKYNINTHLSDVRLPQTAMHMKNEVYDVDALDSDIQEGVYILKDVDIMLERKDSLPDWCASNPVHICADVAVYDSNTLRFTHGVKICGIDGVSICSQTGTINDCKGDKAHIVLHNIEIGFASKKLSSGTAEIGYGCLLLRDSVCLSCPDGTILRCNNLRMHDKSRVEVVGQYTLQRADAMISGEDLKIFLSESGKVKEMKSSKKTIVCRGESRVQGDRMECDGLNLYIYGSIEMSGEQNKLYQCEYVAIDLRDGSIQANNIRAK